MDVRKIAKLAHLEITEEEVALYTPQMANIVAYVEQLNELDTANVEPMLGGLTREGEATATVRADAPHESLGQKRLSIKRRQPSKDIFKCRKFYEFQVSASGFNSRFLSFSFKSSKTKSFLFCAFCSILFTVACSVPNLEKPECAAARQTVKEFYSFHFGNEMKPSKENLQRGERFLSDELKRQLGASTETTKDYFTATDDYPKAFRIGECEVANENTAVFQVVLFWKDDTRSEQREIKVEAVRENEKWLINRIF